MEKKKVWVENVRKLYKYENEWNFEIFFHSIRPPVSNIARHGTNVHPILFWGLFVSMSYLYLNLNLGSELDIAHGPISLCRAR